MAHDQHRALAWDRLQLMQGCEDEDGCLTEAGFGLAEDVDVEQTLGNANLLDCGRKSSCQIHSTNGLQGVN